MQNYLDGHISQLLSFVLGNLDLQREIKTIIVNVVNSSVHYGYHFSDTIESLDRDSIHGYIDV